VRGSWPRGFKNALGSRSIRAASSAPGGVRKKTLLIGTPRSSADLRDQYEGWRRALLQGTGDPHVGGAVLIGRGLTA
jgi:hypothetical protein